MEKELFDLMKKRSKRDISLFLMPAHHGNFPYDLSELNLSIDFTEDLETDNLYEKNDLLKRVHERIARVFGAKYSTTCVNGSSGALISAIYAATNPGDKILLSRNSHISVYRAAEICRLETRYVECEFLDGVNFRVDAKKVIESISKIKPKVFTMPNPTYFGTASDIKKIIDIAKKEGVITIIDEAHGAHFRFSEHLPESAIDCGADIVVHSTHKTLLGLTQTSLLHLASDFSVEKIEDAIRKFHTTSPSYLFMLGNELSAAYMEEYGKKRLEEMFYYISDFKKELSKYAMLFMADNMDFLKIPIKKFGVTSHDLMHHFYKNDIFCEMEDGNYVLLMASLFNKNIDFERVLDVVKQIPDGDDFIFPKEVHYSIPKKSVEIFETKNKSVISIPKKDAVGRISAEYIYPYPPGIPVIVPGEIIEEEHLIYLRDIINCLV